MDLIGVPSNSFYRSTQHTDVLYADVDSAMLDTLFDILSEG